MGRSGYWEDDGEDQWALIRWRGAVKSAIRGKRGQAFLREMLASLDALPAHRLIANELEQDGEVCAIGSVAARRGVQVDNLDPSEPEEIASAFGVAEALVREIAFINDDDFAWDKETPEERFQRVRAWVVKHISKAESS